MSIDDSMEIAASQMAAARAQMNVATSNLANASTTRTAEGGPYKRKNVVLQAVPVTSTFGKNLATKLANNPDGASNAVAVKEIQEDTKPPREVYDPSHPDADASGIVRMPNVNMVEEMVDLIMASRSYEAGVSTMQIIKSMADRALSIGR